MFLKKLSAISHSLAFRLTFWYRIIFTLSTIAAFIIIYIVLSDVLHTRVDESLRKEFNELFSLKKIKGI